MMDEYNNYNSNSENSGQNNNQVNNANQMGHPPYMAKPVVKNAVPKKNVNLAVASLVFGLMALIGFWIPVYDLIFSIIGLIVGILSLAKGHQGRTMAIIGVIFSSLALLLGIAVCFLYILALFV